MNLSSHPVFDIPLLLKSTFLNHVEFHPVLSSTNQTAVELLEPLIEKSPALVLTAEQTAGRGRKGNSWWSSGGALTFSVVLNAASLGLSEERRPLMSIVTGVAVRAALAQFCGSHSVMMKWPNDVYAGNRKICGILAEQHSVGKRSGIQDPSRENSEGQKTGLILGIGVNVNNSLQEAPAEVRQRAVSMFDLEHQVFDLNHVLATILVMLQELIEQACSQPRRFLAEANFHHLLNGKSVLVQAGDSLIAGKCLGIDDTGNLVLQSETEIHRICSGVVQRWS